MFKINSKLSSACIPTTVRFTENIFEQLHTYAQNNNVSFNSLVLQCCEYALDNIKK